MIQTCRSLHEMANPLRSAALLSFLSLVPSCSSLGRFSGRRVVTASNICSRRAIGSRPKEVFEVCFFRSEFFWAFASSQRQPSYSIFRNGMRQTGQTWSNEALDRTTGSAASRQFQEERSWRAFRHRSALR